MGFDILIKMRDFSLLGTNHMPSLVIKHRTCPYTSIPTSIGKILKKKFEMLKTPCAPC